MKKPTRPRKAVNEVRQLPGGSSVEVLHTVVPAAPVQKFLRKQGLMQRYDLSERAIDDNVQKGKLPQPYFLLGTNTPFWLITELDENDQKLMAEARREAS